MSNNSLLQEFINFTPEWKGLESNNVPALSAPGNAASPDFRPKNYRLIVLTELVFPFNPTTGEEDADWNAETPFRTLMAPSDVVRRMKEIASNDSSVKDRLSKIFRQEDWCDDGVDLEVFKPFRRIRDINREGPTRVIRDIPAVSIALNTRYSVVDDVVPLTIDEIKARVCRVPNERGFFNHFTWYWEKIWPKYDYTLDWFEINVEFPEPIATNRSLIEIDKIETLSPEIKQCMKAKYPSGFAEDCIDLVRANLESKFSEIDHTVPQSCSSDVSKQWMDSMNTLLTGKSSQNSFGNKRHMSAF